MFIMKKVGGVIILFGVFLLNFVSAQYISGDIYLYSTGEARFSVDTDVNIDEEGLHFDSEEQRLTGTTEMFMSKQKGIWTFLLNLDSYETIFLDIHFPKSLNLITELDGVDYIFDMDGKTLSLIDYDEELVFKVSYKLNSEIDFSWLFFLIIILLLIIIAYLVIKRKSKKKRLDYILPIINDNEKKIVELLMKKPMRQKEIRKKLDIPKASFSRYIIHLENKKLIIRQGEGKNKIVKLK